MKIKTKLLLGVGLLFVLITMLTALSATYINKLADDTKNILAANYNTIDYSRHMLIALSGGISKNESQEYFKINLEKQKKNVTEVGEGEITQKIATDYESMLKDPANLILQKELEKDITDVMLLNMQAIERKSHVAETTAKNAILYISGAGIICFIIALILLFNLPSNIANPIGELTESIKQIAAKNYSQRLNFDEKNEFGELAESFNTMAKKLQEYSSSSVAKLMMEKMRIETLINNMKEPVIGLDEQRNILFMNDNALKISGLQKEDVIGKSILEIGQKNDLVKTLSQDIEANSSDVRRINLKPVKIYADDKESYFEKEIIPINILQTGETEKKYIGDVILLQNITSHKELDFAKTNLIATISHELKTPISSIKMSLQLLENTRVGDLNNEQKNLVDSINDDASRLLKITGELLNMTQVESGTIQISVVPTNAEEIVEYAVNATRAAADQKNIKIEIKLQNDLPKVLADSEKSAWVLTNLLSNAVRYSYENSTIFINAFEQNKTILFAVKDTGQGISPQYIDKIFGRYFRIPGTKKEGTGLGLSISKEFVEAQGGKLTVESDYGAGSTFTLSLNADLGKSL